MTAGQGGVKGAAHLSAALDGQKVLSHAATVGTEQRLSRRIDAEDLTPLVQQHQTLLHAACDLIEFIPLALQFPQLGIDLAALLVDAAQQGRQLLVGVVIQRVLQIQLVQGLHNVAGHTPGQQRRQNQRHRQHHQKRLEHTQHQHARRGAADGDT